MYHLVGVSLLGIINNKVQAEFVPKLIVFCLMTLGRNYLGKHKLFLGMKGYLITHLQ